MYGLTDPFITWIEVILWRQLRSDSLPDQRVKVEYVIRDGTLALHNRSSAMSTFCLFIYSTDIRVSEVLWHLNTYSASIDEEFPSLSNQMELTLIIESEVILVKLNKIWFLLINALLWYLIYEILNLILELDEHKIFIRNKQQIIVTIKNPIKFQFEQNNIYSMFHRVSGIQLSSNFSRFPFNYSADCTFKLSADYHPWSVNHPLSDSFYTWIDYQERNHSTNDNLLHPIINETIVNTTKFTFARLPELHMFSLHVKQESTP